MAMSKEEILRTIAVLKNEVDQAKFGEAKDAIFADEQEKKAFQEVVKDLTEFENDPIISSTYKNAPEMAEDAIDAFAEVKAQTKQLKGRIDEINKEYGTDYKFADVVKENITLGDVLVNTYHAGRQKAVSVFKGIGDFCKSIVKSVKDLGPKGLAGANKTYHSMMANIHDKYEKHLAKVYAKCVEKEAAIQAKDVIKAEKSQRRAAFFKNIGVRVQNFVGAITNVNRALSFSNIAAMAKGEAIEYDKVEKKPFIDPATVTVNRSIISRAQLEHYDDKLANLAVERAQNKAKILYHTLGMTPPAAREAVTDQYIGSIIEGLEQPASRINDNILGNEFLGEPLNLTTIDGQKLEIGYDGVRIDGQPAFEESRMATDRDGNVEPVSRWTGISHLISPDQVCSIILMSEKDKLISVYERAAENIDARVDLMNVKDDRDFISQLDDTSLFMETARDKTDKFQDISNKLDGLLNEKENKEPVTGDGGEPVAGDSDAEPELD